MAEETFEPFGPLQGVKVLNLSQAIAGPFACAMLGDLGADVIGIENPKGRDHKPSEPGAPWLGHAHGSSQFSIAVHGRAPWSWP